LPVVSFSPVVFPTLLFTVSSPTLIYPLSLHDALPIYRPGERQEDPVGGGLQPLQAAAPQGQEGRGRTRQEQHPAGRADGLRQDRSEEHTSELQSRENLVCRLLLEKKKKRIKSMHTKNE